MSIETSREIVNYILGILIAAALAFSLVFCFGIRVRVIGVSMEETLWSGQTIFINQIAYLLFPPRRNDVVVFMPNGNANTHYYIKRVVGVPGDTVEFIDGKLYVNGEMEADSRFDKVADPGIAAEPVTLGSDEYFMLGDNRNNSEDSRSGNIGLVQRKQILGKAWLHLGGGHSGIGLVD